MWPPSSPADGRAAPRVVPGGRQAVGRLSDGAVTWGIVEEIPVALTINGRSHAVMMASPVDLEDFALGFLLAEGLVSDPAAVEEVTVERHETGIVVAATVVPDALSDRVGAARATAGLSGCGLCGVETLDEAVRPPRRVTPRPAVRDGAILAAFDVLPAHQPMNAATKSVHAAAWCATDGRILLVREDVGRHNALDKLIGARLRAGRAGDDGFVALTSRCGFELVQKAAMADIARIATISAPTSLALDLAARAGISLSVLDRAGGVVVFGAESDPQTKRTAS